jgi:hypothetical protein
LLREGVQRILRRQGRPPGQARQHVVALSLPVGRNRHLHQFAGGLFMAGDADHAQQQRVGMQRQVHQPKTT